MLLAILVIATESTSLFGAQYTSGPLRWVWQHLFGAVDNDTWGHIHLWIRKTGHFVGYGLVGLTWLRAWWLTLPRSGFLLDAALALFGTAVIASSDEFHQSFLSDRTASPWDVLIDCSGAIFLQLVVYLLARLFWPRRLHRSA